MARLAKPLGALEVKRLTEPGLHAVGNKRSDMGLGSYRRGNLLDKRRNLTNSSMGFN